MRSTNRTSAATMLIRYLAIGIPAAAFIGLIFPPFFVLFFFLVMAAIFGLLWAFTNAVVRHFTPDYHNALKAGGGDPFLDNLGAPLNMDPEATRQQGVFPNVLCPHCGVGSFVQPGETVACPSCGGQFKHG